MTKLAVQPIAAIRESPRIPEAGRIRTGVKAATRNGKTAPKALGTFRFTSHHRDQIDAIAAIYGGTVAAWDEPSASHPHQFQVVTAADRVRVAIPGADALSQWYELWSKGGCLRRCDGETCEVAGHDGPAEVACPCFAEGVRRCNLHTRLNVIIPDIAFRGAWRLETHSEYAAREIPGMVDLVIGAAQRGFTTAELGLEERKVVRNGETKRFTIPTLTLAHTPEELLSGRAQLQALNPAPMPALPAAPPAPTFAPDDDGIVDAEVVEDREPSPLEIRCRAQADRFLVSPDALWWGIVRQADRDPVRIERAVGLMESGALEPVGFIDGKVQWIKKDAS